MWGRNFRWANRAADIRDAIARVDHLGENIPTLPLDAEEVKREQVMRASQYATDGGFGWRRAGTNCLRLSVND